MLQLLRAFLYLSVQATWVLAHAQLNDQKPRALAQSGTSDFLLLPGDSPDTSLLVEAVNGSRTDLLNRTIASTRRVTSGSQEGDGGSRNKSVTTITSAVFIALLGLFTFGVLGWAKRHQEQRRARGEHVMDGVEQRQELIQYNEALRLQRIQVLMNQMSENGGPGACPANSQSAFRSANIHSRTNAAHSYSSEGEEEIPGRFRITVPGHMHLNVSDAPPRGVMEGHTSTRALFARQSSRTQDPSTTHSQHLNSISTPRSHSPGPYWDVSDSLARSQSRQFSHGRSGCQVPQEAPSSTDWGTLWDRREPANTQVVQYSSQLNHTRNRLKAASRLLHFNDSSGHEMAAGMGYGYTTATSLGSMSGSDP